MCQSNDLAVLMFFSLSLALGKIWAKFWPNFDSGIESKSAVCLLSNKLSKYHSYIWRFVSDTQSDPPAAYYSRDSWGGVIDAGVR